MPGRHRKSNIRINQGAVVVVVGGRCLGRSRRPLRLLKMRKPGGSDWGRALPRPEPAGADVRPPQEEAG